MPIQLIEQDLLRINDGIIAHQTNCLGVVGGLAKQMALYYPRWYEEYRLYCLEKGSTALGTIQCSSVNKVMIISLFGQDRISYRRRATNYEALEQSLELLGLLGEVHTDKKIYLPYMLGCGLGGGDWAVVSKLIENTCPQAYICKLPGA